MLSNVSVLQYDMRQSRHWEFKAQPDVLVLPSRLSALARDVSGTLVVNPGHLTRGVGGGTFAQLHIHPLKEADLRASIVQQPAGGATNGAGAADAQAYPHSVCARTSVSINKI
jgi:hypothetical protein